MSRRAFALVEALAATVLLAVVAAACMPVLSSAARLAADPALAVDPGALAELADRIAADPAAFGVEENAVEIDWPEGLVNDTTPDPAVAIIYTGDPPESAATGAPTPRERWLSVTCGARATVRWLPRQPPLPASVATSRSARAPRRVRRKRRMRTTPMRTGITLVETLVALAIVAMLAIAVVGWTVGSARTAAGAERAARASSATEGIFRLVREDLMCGDFEVARARQGEARIERVRIESGSLVVSGRRPDADGGAVRRYVHDARARTLLVVDEPPEMRGSSRSSQGRVVAEGVAEFSVREEGARRGEAPRAIEVTVALDGGEATTRRLALR